MPPPTIKVLLIEDNPGDANLVQDLLEEGGEGSFILEFADRLAKGLARIAEGGIDVVLLDLSLPDSHGLSTLESVIAASPHMPVVILTGQQEEQLGLDAVYRGAQDYLSKGQFTAINLARAIRYAHERCRWTHDIRDKEAQLRLLTQQLPAILWTADTQLRCTSSLGKGLEKLNLEPGQMVGQSLAEYLGNDPEFPALAAHYRALRGESVSMDVEWKGRMLQAQIQPLRTNNEHIVGIIGVALDVTDNRRVEHELKLAGQIQQELLPSAAPALAGFDIGGRSLPAEATGGDFYDYVPFKDGSLGIVIGDVSGHGLGPALLAAVTHACLRTLAQTGLSLNPDTILTTTNRVLSADTGDQFVTMLYAHLDPEKRCLAYSNAGHPPGIVLGSCGREKSKLLSTAPPVGPMPDIDFPMGETIYLEAGDLVLLLTDGVPDTMAPDESFFGMDRTLALVRENRHLKAQELADLLCRKAFEFAGGGRQHDDITVVVIKVS